MPPTWLVVILIFFGLFALVAGIILFAPFFFRTDFSVSPESRNATLAFSWIHPLVARVTWSVGDDAPRIRIFGRSWGAKHDSAPPQPEPVPHREPVSRAEPVSPVHTQRATPSPADQATSAPSRPDPARQEPLPDKPADATMRREGADTTMHGTDAEPEPAAAPKASLRNRLLPYWTKARLTWSVLRRHRMASRLARWCVRVLSLTLRLVRFDHGRIHLRAGSGDPARLGKLYGWYISLHRLLLGAGKKLDLRFEPRFQEKDLALEGSIGLHTSIAHLIAPAAVGLFTFPWLRAFLVWWRLRKVYQKTVPGDTITGAE